VTPAPGGTGPARARRPGAGRGEAPFEEALRAIAAARDPAELFGPPPEDAGPPGAAAVAAYRRLARRVHPDRAPRGRADEAGRAFAALGALWAEHRVAAETGGGTVLATRTRRYRVGPVAARGDIADVRPVRYRDGGPRAGALKLARSPADNDLLLAEAEALERITGHGRPEFRAFFPEPVEAIRHRDPATGVERHGTVLGGLAGFVPLSELHRAHPDGIDPRDAAWMWRRLLAAAGAAAEAGVVHGAIVPEHVLIHPEEHGLVLIDWCYSVTAGAPGRHVPALVPGRTGFYPPEVPDRRPAAAATDVFMAARCMEHITGGRLPKPLRAFARGCTLPSPARRPADGFAALSDLDDLLERRYGPRRFRPFSTPARRIAL